MSGGGRRSPPLLRSKGGSDLPTLDRSPVKPNAGYNSVSRGAKGRFVSGAINGCSATSLVEGQAIMQIEGGIAVACVDDEMVERHGASALDEGNELQLVTPVNSNGAARFLEGRPKVSDAMDAIDGCSPPHHSFDVSAGPLRLVEEANAINEACQKATAVNLPYAHHDPSGEHMVVGPVLMNDFAALNPSLPCEELCFNNVEAAGKINDINGVKKDATATCTPSVRANACKENLDWTAHKTAWAKPNVIAAPPLKNLGHLAAVNGVAQLDTKEVESFFTKFKAALVGRLFGKHIPYHHLLIELQRRWSRFGDFKLVTLSNECFVCAFASTDARDAILMGGPWLVAGQVLGLDRWTPDFSLSTMHGFVTPIWVRFPGLPLYCWGVNSLTSISSLLGEPIWIEEAAHEFGRGSFARACVRLDLSKPLLPFIWVQGHEGPFKQKVEYEGFSAFCQHCGKVGHKLLHCPLIVKLPKNSPHGVPPHSKGESTFKFAASQGTQHSAFRTSEGTSGDAQPADILDVHLPAAPHESTVNVEDDGNGPWLLAPRRRRSHKAVRPKGRDLHQDKLHPRTCHSPSDRDNQLLSKPNTKDRPPLFPFDAATFTAGGFRRARKGREVTHKGKAIFLQPEGCKTDARATQEPPKKRKSLVYAVDEDASSFVPP